MKYTRPLQREEEKNEFSIGSHPATITTVKETISRNTGSDMFIMKVVGEKGEEVTFYLTFGNDYTEKNINFLLASIEDNGVEIPDIDFGYNKQTRNFLRGKAVYIEVKKKDYKGNKSNAIDKFLSLAEFEESEVSQENAYDDWAD